MTKEIIKKVVLWVAIALVLWAVYLAGKYRASIEYQKQLDIIIKHNSQEESKYKQVIDQCSLILDYTEKKKAMELKRYEFNQASADEAKLRTKIKQELLGESDLDI